MLNKHHLLCKKINRVGLVVVRRRLEDALHGRIKINNDKTKNVGRYGHHKTNICLSWFLVFAIASNRSESEYKM